MKKIIARIKLALFVSFATIGRVVVAVAAPHGPIQKPSMGQLVFTKQGGFVLLGKNYAGYASGTIVELPASTEAALIASGQATLSAGPPTTGAVTTTANSGCAAIAAGSSSVTITNANVTVQSQIVATVAQAVADGTLLRVERILPAAGSFTIYGTANATATTLVKWAIVNPNGSLAAPI